MADAPDTNALTDAVKALITAVNDQKRALIAAIDDQKEVLTQALAKIPQASPPTPSTARFRGTAAEIAVIEFNDIIADLGFVPFKAGTLTATAVSSHQIDLKWTEPNRNPNGFKIERRDAPSAYFSQIAELGPDVRSYSDGGLNEKTTYYYKVHTIHTAGNLPETTEAAATTLDNDNTEYRNR